MHVCGYSLTCTCTCTCRVTLCVHVHGRTCINTQLAYVSNPDSSDKADLALGFYRLQCLEDLVQIVSQSHTNLATAGGGEGEGQGWKGGGGGER